jgi:hypothetical protein
MGFGYGGDGDEEIMRLEARKLYIPFFICYKYCFLN